MPGQIYLIGEGGQLQPMQERAYEQEDVFQRLLEDYPDLLAGDQLKPESPLRWMLVTREASIPDHEDGSARWAIDHLFLDQHGVPTLVEVKRSSDTRLRREVVGQMLDYAANAVVYWPAGSIRTMYEDERREHDEDPDKALVRRFELAEDEIETYWQRVDTNLRARRVRLLFVADEIPMELQRIVEFLNEQMSPAEVLAVEIRQFVGGTVRTLVPRVIGKTAEADRAKGGGRGRPSIRWTPSRIRTWADERAGSADAENVRRLLELAEAHSASITTGSGAGPGFGAQLRYQDTRITVWTMRGYGTAPHRLEICFGYVENHAGAAAARRYRDLIGRAGGVFADIDLGKDYPTSAVVAEFEDGDFARLESITLELKRVLVEVGAGPDGQ